MTHETALYEDMEAFLRVAKYPLVKHCDMTAEMKEEATDICITAVEKYASEMEKCTHVRFLGFLSHRRGTSRSIADDQGYDGQEIRTYVARHRGQGLLL